MSDVRHLSTSELRAMSRKAPRRHKIGPEACLQMSVIAHLNVGAPPNAIYHSIPNEGKRSPAAAGYLRKMGLLPGVADLFIAVPGHKPGYLELKGPGERPNEDQLAFADLCERGGHVNWAYADNINWALTILHDWGALPRLARLK